MKMKLLFLTIASDLLAGILWVQIADRSDRIAKEAAAALEIKRATKMEHYVYLKTTIACAAKAADDAKNSLAAGRLTVGVYNKVADMLQADILKNQIELETYPSDFPAHLK